MTETYGNSWYCPACGDLVTGGEPHKCLRGKIVDTPTLEQVRGAGQPFECPRCGHAFTVGVRA